MTSVPPAGENVTLRRAGRSAAGDAALRVRRRRISAIATRISISANAAPMQRRTPPPNGIHAEVDGAAVEEALGPEGERLGVAVRARVSEPDRRRDVGPRRQHVPVDLERRGQPPAGQRDDRPQPQRLGDDRAQVAAAS